MARYSIVEYTGDGATTEFQFGFPYMYPEDVVVRVDGLPVLFTISNVPDQRVVCNVAPPLDSAVVIQRETEIEESLATFLTSATIRPTDLNTLATQTLYLNQEDRDKATIAFENASDAIDIAEGAVDIANQAAADAATAVSVSSQAAADAATAILTSQDAEAAANLATAAANDATAAADAATLAADAATLAALDASADALVATQAATQASADALVATATANLALSTADGAVITADAAALDAAAALAASTQASYDASIASADAALALSQVGDKITDGESVGGTSATMFSPYYGKDGDTLQFSRLLIEGTGAPAVSSDTFGTTTLTFSGVGGAVAFEDLTGSYFTMSPSDPNPAHAEGRVFYDDVDKSLAYYTEESEVTHNVGRELWTRVKNSTGSTVTNGTVVYISGSDGTNILISPADCGQFLTSRALGVATHDIETGTFGYITKFGAVRNVNTSGWAAGTPLYLSDTPGVLTDTSPTGGCFSNIIATVVVSDASVGVIQVDIDMSQLAVEVTDTNGFPPDQRTATTLSFVDGTRTFSITPTGSQFHFYQGGRKYIKTSTQTVVITDVEGNHAIYFDDGVLSSIQNPSASQEEDLILNRCYVAHVYWDYTNKQGLVFDERHGINMPPEVHKHDHIAFGTLYPVLGGGLDLGDFTGGDGSSDADAQFSITSGYILDQDLPTSISAVASTTGLRIFYLDGSNANLRYVDNPGYPIIVNGGTSIPRYNQLSGINWVLTDVTNNYYYWCHVVAANGNAQVNKIFAVAGVAEYGSITTAEDGAANELAVLRSLFKQEEYVPIASVLFRYRSNFTNTYKTRIITLSDGGTYIDWRSQASRGVNNVVFVHNSLAGRSEPNCHPATAISTLTDGTTYLTTDVQTSLEALDAELNTHVGSGGTAGSYLQHAVASTSGSGFLPTLSGSSTEFLNGTGAWSTPAGGGGGSSTVAMYELFTTAVITPTAGDWRQLAIPSSGSGLIETDSGSIASVNGSNQIVIAGAGTYVISVNIGICNFSDRGSIRIKHGSTQVGIMTGSYLGNSCTVRSRPITASASDVITIETYGTVSIPVQSANFSALPDGNGTGYKSYCQVEVTKIG